MATDKESLAARFRAMRFNDNKHLGLGDVRLTLWEQEQIEKEFAELEARLATAEADSMRLDKLQESFIKGEEFHIVLCEGKNDDEDCEHDTHPHFEAFDWSWRSSPVRASTLRDVIDKALAEGGKHG